MDTVEVNQITIDDKEYIVVEVIDNYYYLVNIKDETDMMIQKREDDYLVNLDNNKEFNKALELFTNKNNK